MDSLPLSFLFFMDMPIVNIESDVVETIFRPMSLFLNTVEVGTKLTWISTSESPSRANPDVTVYHYKFLASNGNVYSFTQYDINSFTINGVSFREHFKLQHGKQALLNTEFTILGEVQRKTSRDGSIMYPPFAYEGYNSYVEQIRAGADRAKASEVLYATKVLEDFKDRYYRLVDIDGAIIYYQD